MRSACIVVLLAGACTDHNPLYTPGTDLAMRDGAMPIAIVGDMTMPAVGDMTTGTPCAAGERSCTTTGSERCQAGILTADRTCPDSSMCTNGYCSVPPGGIGQTMGKSCAFGGGASQATCQTGASSPETCQPFIAAAGPPAQVTWVCDTSVGAGVAGTACTNDTDCNSGFCGGNGTCFVACVTVGECGGSMQMQCKQVAIMVEGSPVMASSCIPM
jgi:hypothetical protein